MYQINSNEVYDGMVTVMVNTLEIAPLHSESPLQKRSGMARVLKGFQFYLHIHTFICNQNEPYLPWYGMV